MNDIRREATDINKDALREATKGKLDLPRSVDGIAERVRAHDAITDQGEADDVAAPLAGRADGIDDAVAGNIGEDVARGR